MIDYENVTRSQAISVLKNLEEFIWGRFPIGGYLRTRLQSMFGDLPRLSQSVQVYTHGSLAEGDCYVLVEGSPPPMNRLCGHLDALGVECLKPEGTETHSINRCGFGTYFLARCPNHHAFV